MDDNQDFLRLLSLELSYATKWIVSTARSVAEAEQIVAAQTIDFALLDLILPDGNGIELATELRNRKAGLQVAIVTGAELSTAEENDCRQHQFDIVSKPFLAHQIIDLVQERVIKRSHVARSA